MARTTGYTATSAVRMMNAGLYPQGIIAPEVVGGSRDVYRFLLDELPAGVIYQGTRLPEPGSHRETICSGLFPAVPRHPQVRPTTPVLLLPLPYPS